MKKKYLAVGIVVLLLSGCIVRFVYNQLDWIIPWYVNSVIDLNDDQETFLEKKLKVQLRWHRVTQLPEYSKSLKEVGSLIQNGLTVEDMDRFHDTMRSYWHSLVRRIGPDIAEILSTSSDEQLNEMLAKFEERHEKFKEEYIDLPEEERRQKKVERMTRFLKFCMGSVNEKQEKIVDQWSRDLKNISSARLRYILKTHNQFKEMLKRRNEKAWFKKELVNLLYFERDTWPKDFREMAEYNRELTKRVFLQIYHCMSADQREEFIETALSLAEDFDQLSKET
jgi:hypothetical protein